MFTCKIDAEVELRLLEIHHAEELFALIEENRVYLREWMPWVDANGKIEDTQKFIQMSRQQYADNSGLQVGIWYLGKIAGVLGFARRDPVNRGAEIGYWVSAAYQGRGLVTRACRAVIDYAFAELDLHRLEIRCDPQNVKSRAIPERLGFQQEGMLRQVAWLHDHFVDLIVYSMLADEWHKGNK